MSGPSSLSIGDAIAPISPRPGNYALEITGKAIGEVEAAREDLPEGTQINIAFLGNESHEQRINAARIIRANHCSPVPIISSRRLTSEQDRDAYLSGLIEQAAPDRFLLVGGDPDQAAGPYQDSIALIEGGIIERFGIKKVGIVAYPEGHPKIETSVLRDYLRRKVDLLLQKGCEIEITTQYGFDPMAIVDWLAQVRGDGIACPIRLGIPAPAKTGPMLRFARQFGTPMSPEALDAYGIVENKPDRIIGPEAFLRPLEHALGAQDLGPILFHLYPFGGIERAVKWAADYARARTGSV